MEISIIIPHYNSSDELFKLLESIPNNKKIEIIVIDDYSKKEEIEKIQNSKYINDIIFLKNTGKKGAGTCRNIGINNSSKKWIAFADADDFYTKDFFKVIEKNYDENIDVIYFEVTSCYSDTLEKAERHFEIKKLIENYRNLKTKESSLDLKYKWVVPWGKIIRADLIKENNIYFDEIIAANDVMFSIKVAEKTNNFKIEDLKIYCTTIRQGSLTLRKNKNIFEARFDVHKRKNQFFKDRKLYQYVTPGISFLIWSRKYGIKIFFKTMIYVFSNILFLFNGKADWKRNMQSKWKSLIKDRKYMIEDK